MSDEQQSSSERSSNQASSGSDMKQSEQNLLKEEFRKKLFEVYLAHAPDGIHKIPGLLDKYGTHGREQLENLYSVVLWKLVAKGDGPCPVVKGKTTPVKTETESATCPRVDLPDNSDRDHRTVSVDEPKIEKKVPVFNIASESDNGGTFDAEI